MVQVEVEVEVRRGGGGVRLRVRQPPTWSSRICCNTGRSMTTLGFCPRAAAGFARSKVANHSFETPSLSPFTRSPRHL